MGRVLDLTPPAFEGDVTSYAREVERYLYKLTESVDYELYKMKKAATTATMNTEVEENEL